MAARRNQADTEMDATRTYPFPPLPDAPQPAGQKPRVGPAQAIRAAVLLSMDDSKWRTEKAPDVRPCLSQARTKAAQVSVGLRDGEAARRALGNVESRENRPRHCPSRSRHARN